MRATVRVDSDTAQAVPELESERGRGRSDAVNELIRRGLLDEPRRAPFEPRTRRLGIRIEVFDLPDALDLLEGPRAR